jgi:hypothetical protein
MSKLLAPNGKPSNLTPEQYKLVRSSAFKKWFGDWEKEPENASKVVDENGEPKVMYHSTDIDFNIFQPSWRGVIFFSYTKIGSQNASLFGASKTIECFLNCRKIRGNKKTGIYFGDVENKKYQDKIKKENFDAIYVRDESKGTIAVFNSTQMKLADGTNITFDANNPDIRFDGGGKVLGYNDVIKKQQIDNPYSDVLFSNKNSKFIEETIDIKELRELNGFSDDEDEIEQTISYFNDLGMDEDYAVGRKLMNKIVDGVQLSPIVVDEEYKVLDGSHRLSAYSELYYYFGYDYPFDGKLKIYKRIYN